MQGLDVEQQTPLRGGVEGGFEQDAVVAVGAVGGPTPRDTVGIRCEGPFPPGFGPVAGVFPVPCPPQGALCWLPSTETSVRSNPMMRS